MDDIEAHKLKMAELKAEVDRQIAAAVIDKGVILVLTGSGKGKSSSAFGMALRSLGHSLKVGVVQFIKGQWRTGEQVYFMNHPQVTYFAMGAGFTWNTQDKAGDTARVLECWEVARTMILDGQHRLVVLDEINVVLDMGYLDVNQVIEVLLNKPKEVHVVLTGRNAPAELCAIADTVSVVESPKHAFDAGVKAQRGIEF